MFSTNLDKHFTIHFAFLELMTEALVFGFTVIQGTLEKAGFLVLLLQLRSEVTSSLSLNLELIAKALVSLLDVLELFFRELFMLRQVVDLAFQLDLVFLEFFVLALDSAQFGLGSIRVTSTKIHSSVKVRELFLDFI